MPSSLVKAPNKLRRMPSVITRPDGSVVAANKKRIYETPFFLLTNPPVNNVTFPALGTSATAAMRVASAGPMQVVELGAQRTNPCTVMLYINDGVSPKRMMNAPCHIDTLFGNGGLMYPLAEALYLDENRALSIAYTDLANSGNNAAQVALSCSRYGQIQDDPTLGRIKQRLSSKEYLSMPFFLTFDQQSVTLASLANTMVNMQIPQDINFEVHQISFVSTGSFALNITNAESGVALINAPSNDDYNIPNLMMCGTNQHPYRFSEPWLLFGGQNLTISLADTSQASNTIWITLGGKMVSPKQWS